MSKKKEKKAKSKKNKNIKTFLVTTTETISRQFVIQSTSLDEAQEKVDEEGYDNLPEYEDGWHSSGETLSDIEESDDDFSDLLTEKDED